MHHDPPAIVIVEPPGPLLVVVEPPGPVLVAEVAAQGPPGPPGPAEIGGFGIHLHDTSDGDLLSLQGSHWTNRRQDTLTDGGNF
jgi:hypothetical protein